MLFRYRHTTFARLICLLLALHLLNLSIDPRDAQPDSVPEDLSLNDIETITEFFAEVILNRVDAFQEHDEKDNGDGGAVDAYKYFCSNNSIVIKCSPITLSSPQKFHSRNLVKIESPSVNIIIPPPRG
jgi:hypothetical protein